MSGNLSCAVCFDVLRRGAEPLRVVLERSEADVAPIAQQRPDYPRRVVVVYVRGLLHQLRADGAAAVLLLRHSEIRVRVEAVLHLPFDVVRIARAAEALAEGCRDRPTLRARDWCCVLSAVLKVAVEAQSCCWPQAALLVASRADARPPRLQPLVVARAASYLRHQGLLLQAAGRADHQNQSSFMV